MNMLVETGHNCGDRATNDPVTPAISNGPAKKGNMPQAMAALCG
jgi:hypothetical protein